MTCCSGCGAEWLQRKHSGCSDIVVLNVQGLLTIEP